ncbi:MAG TPA: RagB/SusD family nutrient uptake outer membrane protein, partial [Puia sp.]
QSSSLNTVMLRFADVYLIAAEAILGQSAGANAAGLDTLASTNNATAIGYFNKIRQRAGLPQVPGGGSITFRDIIKERRLEFAIEGDYWFDLCRLDGFNATRHPKAIAIIKAQDRGSSSNDYPNYVRYGDGYFKPTDGNFKFPYPATEVAADPLLAADPVPYKFK